MKYGRRLFRRISGLTLFASAALTTWPTRQGWTTRAAWVRSILLETRRPFCLRWREARCSSLPFASPGTHCTARRWPVFLRGCRSRWLASWRSWSRSATCHAPSFSCRCFACVSFLWAWPAKLVGVVNYNRRSYGHAHSATQHSFGTAPAFSPSWSPEEALRDPRSPTPAT